jgi:hypothetical protein
MYQKLAKAYNRSYHLGISPSMPGFRYAEVASEMSGTINPHKVIMLGASQSGKQLFAIASQNGLKM